MKKLISAMLMALAIARTGVPAVWAAEVYVGRIAGMHTNHDSVYLVIITMEGRYITLEANPAQARDLRDGDAVEITAEGSKVQAVKKKP